jgi:geranylgeranyl diphosphate synthase type I
METLSKLSSVLLPAIEEELHVNIDHAFLPEVGELRFMLSYHLGWEGEGAGTEAQGKRIRPLLVLLAAVACGSNWQKALPAAAAVELIHNFSLIHDDIQDQSPLRRGRSTLWTKWGIAQAINAGDTMFSLAQLAMLKLQMTTSIQVALAASRLLNATCVDLTQGQYLDLSYAARSDISQEDYWPMIGGKTASLLATCTELGALIGGTSPEIQGAARDFGRNLGMAFQVQDDLLGIWGKTGQIGKSNESDLVSGKKTLPVLFGLSHKGKFARRWNSRPISTAEVPEVVDLLLKEGALDYTQNMADQLTQRALQALDQAFPARNEGTEALIELAYNLLQRQS